jgi:hypothetical protein
MESKPKIVYAGTILYKNDLDSLKQKTGKTSNKDAIAEAVRYYLEQHV